MKNIKFLLVTLAVIVVIVFGVIVSNYSTRKKDTSVNDFLESRADANFNPNDIEETTRWHESLSIQELLVTDSDNPLSRAQYAQRMKAYLTPYVDHKVKWKLDIGLMYMSGNEARATIESRSDSLKVNTPDIIALIENLGKREEPLYERITISRRDYLKLKSGMKITVNGIIWYVSLGSITLKDCRIEIP